MRVEAFNRVGYQFDYQQLVRFGIDESRLPPTAIVFSRPHSFYRENRPLIWTVTLFILGQSAVIVAFTWNVVRRRRAERDLARTEADLRQSQKMDAIGRLAGGIAHDFNNLLTVINGHSALLSESPDDVTPQELKTSVREIEKAGNQAATLTRQLLAFGRKQVLQARVVNLNRDRPRARVAARRVSSASASRCRPRSIRRSPTSRSIRARSSRSSSTSSSTPVTRCPTGGRIVLGTRNADRYPDVDGAAGRDCSCVVLTVADTGQGMSPETRTQIFEPFFTTKPEGKGTGLGLATVYGIVRQSGGWIEVDSAPGHGTTFTLYFPATQAAAEPSEAAATPGPARRASARVLVVEDQPEVRELAVMALRRAGYQVSEAGDGDEAFARFGDRAASLELLLTDVVMPGMNGRDLAGRMRAANPQLLVVFMSGYAQEILDPQELGGQDAAFVAKPFTPSVLVREVDRLLSSRRRVRKAGAPDGARSHRR